jgi:hydroxyacylglutathione hydrolase
MGETRMAILGLGMARAYILIGEDGVVLVDSGISGSALLGALARARVEPTSLSLLLVTHAHADHFGGAAALLEAVPGLRTAMGRLDAASLGAHPAGDVDLAPIGRKGAFGLHLARAARGGERGSAIPAAAFVPGTLLAGGESLATYGVDAEVLAVPGHTAGSMAVLVRDARDGRGRPLGNAAIVGDLVMGGFIIHGLPGPPFFGDLESIRASLARLKALGVTRLYPGHGGPLDAERVWRRFRL